MVGSGGCTASLFATHSEITKMHLVDLNPYQLALCKFKIELLKKYTPKKRLGILGHSYMDFSIRKNLIIENLSSIGCTKNSFGNIDQVTELGIDFIGKYEHLFALLRNLLNKKGKFFLSIIKEEKKLDAELAYSLKKSLDQTMSLPVLTSLFGSSAVQNRAIPYSDHFFNQIISVIKNPNLKIKENPYLQQMLLGNFLENTTYPWLKKEKQTTLPEIVYSNNNILESLKNSKEKYDFIHLSNVLDWLNQKEASDLLEAVSQKLKKDGCLIIRKLNSKLEFSSFCNSILWNQAYAKSLLDQDRSFFYSKIYVGTKK